MPRPPAPTVAPIGSLVSTRVQTIDGHEYQPGDVVDVSTLSAQKVRQLLDLRRLEPASPSST
jgi:hypothetical protein